MLLVHRPLSCEVEKRKYLVSERVHSRTQNSIQISVIVLYVYGYIEHGLKSTSKQPVSPKKNQRLVNLKFVY